MSEQEHQIEIKLSKVKLILMLLGCIVFVGLGVLFFCWVKNPPNVDNPVFNNPLLFILAGTIAILFFGFIGISIAKKLGDNSPGLIISSKGIIDNSSGIAAGLILWQDIEEIRVMTVSRRQKIILLLVNNPEEYINRKKTKFMRRVMEMNYKMFGTPVQIVANGLQCNYRELKELIESNYTKYHVTSVE